MKLVEADFYTQFEFNFEDVSLPEEIAFLYKGNFLNYLIKQFEELFSVRLANQVDVTAHRLVRGHTIRLHTYTHLTLETQRMLIQLNRHWTDENS